LEGFENFSGNQIKRTSDPHDLHGSPLILIICHISRILPIGFIAGEEEKKMSYPEAIFKITEENNCPLYGMGDEFKLSGKSLLLKTKKDEKTFITTSVIKMPSGKPVCRILIEDLTSVLIKCENMDTLERYVLNCGGCSGLIRLEYNRGEENAPVQRNHKKPEDDINALVGLLYIFPIFQSLEEHDIEKIVPLLKMKKFPEGAAVIRKGEPGSNLYIIISGVLDVLVDDDICITSMETGDVFGEISLLLGTPVSATVRVSQTARLLYIRGKEFRELLDQYPSLQIYFARLLAGRLAKTNDDRFRDMASGISGSLSEMPPSELFQTLNLNRKTGVLNLSLPKGQARAVFREGSLIRTAYDNKEGKPAFFSVLREKKGRFKFLQGLPPEDEKTPELGDFMWLLMEGIRRIDDENKNA
jgi:CRP-like cAMP-binding protein